MAIYDVSGCRAEIIRPNTTLAKWVASQPVKPFAVINASLYDMKTYEPCGTVIENGAVVHNDGDGCGFGYKGNDIYFGTVWDRKYTGFLTGYNSPVWGKKYIEPSWTDTYVFGSKNTRIGIGSKNGKPCIVTADGVTLKGFADYAMQQGCDYLVNLDGGGSRFLYYDGKTIHSSSRTPYNAIVFYKIDDEKKESVKAEISVVKCPYKEPTALVKMWSIGEGAKWTQWYLNQHGYDLKVDGLFYNASVKALEDFQSKHGLEVDGKSGPLTREVLKRISNYGSSEQHQQLQNKSVKITASLLNVRSGAGTNYAIVGSLKNGSIVEVYDEKDGWYKVQNGWISKNYAKDVITPDDAAETYNKLKQQRDKIVEYCERQVGSMYVYGAQAQTTSSTIDWSANCFPNYTTATRAARMKKYLREHQDLPNGEPMRMHDCSGLIWAAIEYAGFDVVEGKKITDSTAAALYSLYCNPISKSELKQGDLVFSSALDHVAIVGNDGDVIECAGSDIGCVRNENIDSRIVKSIYGPQYGCAEYYSKAPWTKYGRFKRFDEANI